MTKICCSILLFICSVSLFGQKSLAGIYSTNFPTYGMFGKTLTLNCDSSTVLNFRGDLMNDTSRGVWTLRGKFLIVIFDSIAHPSQRYKTPLNFKIKRSRLYPINLNRTDYEKLKLDAEKSALENHEKLKLPSYSTFQKRSNKTPRDFKGRYGNQYFKIAERFTCDSIKNR
jgi:hypothetical protein